MAGEANVKTTGPRTPGGRTTPVLVPQAALAGQPDIPLDRPVTTVGSNEQSRLHLVSRTVSKGHAIFVNTGGITYVADMASRTGVLVNGKLIKDADLKTGDRVQIGKFVFRYRSPANTSPPPPQPESPPAAVIVVGSPAVPIARRCIIIGRRDTCDVAIPTDAGVSAGHAVIFQMEGRWYIRDLASRTGTNVNGKAIHQQVLNFGDRITIGSATILFQPGAVQADPLEDSGIIELEHGTPIDREEDIEILPQVSADEIPNQVPAAEHLVDWKSAFPATPTEEVDPEATQTPASIPLEEIEPKENRPAEDTVIAIEPSALADDDFDFLSHEPETVQQEATPAAPEEPKPEIEPVAQAPAPAIESATSNQDDFDFLAEEFPSAETKPAHPAEDSAAMEPIPVAEDDFDFLAEDAPAPQPVEHADASALDEPAPAEEISTAAETVPPADDAFDFLAEEPATPTADAAVAILEPAEAVDELGLAVPEIPVEAETPVELKSISESPATEAVAPAPVDESIEFAEPPTPVEVPHEAPVAETENPAPAEAVIPVESEPLALEFVDEAAPTPITETIPLTEPEPIPVADAPAESGAALPPVESSAPVEPPAPVGIIPPVVASELLEAVDDFVFVPSAAGPGDGDVIFWGDDTVSVVPPPPPPPPPPPAKDQSSDDDETPPDGGPPDSPPPVVPGSSGNGLTNGSADHVTGNGRSEPASPQSDDLIEFADSAEPVAQASEFRIEADSWTAPSPLVFEPVPDIHMPEFQPHELEDDYSIPFTDSLGAAFSAAESWLQAAPGVAVAPMLELSEEALTDAVSLVPEINWAATINTGPLPEDGAAEAAPAAVELVEEITPAVESEPVAEIDIPTPASEAAGFASATPEPFEAVDAQTPIVLEESAIGEVEAGSTLQDGAAEAAPAAGESVQELTSTVASEPVAAIDLPTPAPEAAGFASATPESFEADAAVDSEADLDLLDFADLGDDAFPRESTQNRLIDPPPTPEAAGLASATPESFDAVNAEPPIVSEDGVVHSAVHEFDATPTLEDGAAEAAAAASNTEQSAEELDESSEASGFELLPETTLTGTPITNDFTPVIDDGSVLDARHEESITLTEEWAAPVDPTVAESDLDLLDFADEQAEFTEPVTKPAVDEIPIPEAPVTPAEDLSAPVEPTPAAPVRPAEPPAQRRGPSLFGFDFEGSNFLGGMPIALAGQAAMPPGGVPSGLSLTSPSAIPTPPADLAASPPPPPPTPPADLSPAPAPMPTTAPESAPKSLAGFDLNTTAPSGLGAMLNPSSRSSASPMMLTPPRPLPRPARPATPAVEPVSMSGLVGELRPSMGTPVIPPVEKGALAGQVRNLTGAARGSARRSADVFAQHETPIGVEVFGGKPSHPNQINIPETSANESAEPAAVATAPAAPLPVVPLKVRWSRLPVWVGLMILIPALTWFGLRTFFHESVTEVGRLSFAGVGLQSDVDLHDFHGQQELLACSDDVRQKALAIIGDPTKADFLADSDKYRDFVQPKDFTWIDNSTLEFQLSYPDKARCAAFVNAIMQGLVQRDQDLNVARRDARVAADTAKADYDSLQSQLEQLRGDYHKKSAEAESYPDPLSVSQASQAVVDLTQKWQTAVTDRSNTESILAQIKSQDPSKPIDADADPQIVDLKSRLQPLLDQIQIAKSRGGVIATSPSGLGTDVSVGAATQPDADPLLGALQAQADALSKKIQDRRDDLAVLSAIPAAQRVVDQTRQIEDLTVKLNTLRTQEKDLKSQLDTATDLANKNKAMLEAAHTAEAERQDINTKINDAEAQLKIKSDDWQKKETAFENVITVASGSSDSKNPSVRYVSTTDLGKRFLLMISVMSSFFLLLLIWGELRRPRLISGQPAGRGFPVGEAVGPQMSWPQANVQ